MTGRKILNLTLNQQIPLEPTHSKNLFSISTKGLSVNLYANPASCLTEGPKRRHSNTFKFVADHESMALKRLNNKSSLQQVLFAKPFGIPSDPSPE